MARRKTGARAWVRVSNHTKEKTGRDRRWEVAYEDPRRGYKRRTKGGFLNKKAAEDWRDDFTRDTRVGAWVDPALGDVTFQAVAQAWLATYTSAKARGYSQHDQIINGKRSLLRTEFGGMRIGDVTPLMVGVWIRKMHVEHGRSASTIRHNFYTLRKVMRFALSEGRLQRDPTADIETPKPRDLTAEEADRYPLNMQEVAALIAAVPDPWGMYVRLAAATGMRPEELCGLQLRDVTADCDVIEVRRVLVKVGRELVYEKQAKTPKSRRSIEIDDETASLLKAYVKTHNRLALKWFSEHQGQMHPGEALPLFVGVTDFKRGQRQRKDGTDLDWLDYSKPVSHGWFFMRHWDTARTKAGLPAEVRFYDLRHFHASWHVARLGQPGALTITEISERLGHASTAMTLNRYSHSPRDRAVEKKAALGAMWTSAEASNVTKLQRKEA